ncbi:chaperone/ATP-dependent lon protease [Thermus phage P23-45]|uniref:Chaperone/ATP-dependent lon protease n=1 Tax=Thermus virus P23-45 TaxID=2914006 RepID=A7XX79_BP234|nr:ATP-dependent protease [Thermus phage P23-45]ABU96884.1 chaperone/ATP-dependent lon protease [Thermus phage P23-45]
MNVNIQTIEHNGVKLYVPSNVYAILNAALDAAPKSKRALGLAGPSGVAKTSLAHALLEWRGYEVYQMDIGGLLDPVAIEGTVILQNGQTFLKPSPFLQGLLRAQEGRKVGIVLDEINRGHPTALNRLFRALAQGEFYSDWYGLLRTDNVVFISTANAGVEYTVSKLDRAMKERHLWVYIPRPEPVVLGTILKDRVPSLTDAQVGFIVSLYNSDSGLVSVREALDFAHLLANGVNPVDAVELVTKGGAYVANMSLEVVDGLVAAAKAQYKA